MIPTRRNSSPKARSLFPALPHHSSELWPELLEKSSLFGDPNSVTYCSWERLPYWAPPLSHKELIMADRKCGAPLSADFSSWPCPPRGKRVDVGTAPHRTHTRQDTRGERGDENTAEEKAAYDSLRQGTERKNQASMLPPQPDVPRIGKQHRNRSIRRKIS